MTSATARKTPSPWLVWLALLTVYIVWGSTYLGIRVVVQSMPPLLAASLRFLPAALIVFVLVVSRGGFGALRITRREAMGTAFIGACLLLTGNGFVSLAEQTVPSGLAAVLGASIPLVMVVFRVGFGERPRRLAIFGVLFGFAGVAVLVLPQGLSGTASFLGLGLLMLSTLSWSFGSVMTPRVTLPRDSYTSTAYQMLFGSLMLGVAGVLHGEVAQFDVAAFKPESFLALGYLIVFGSVIAFPAYAWLLQNAPIGKVATYAYVNPVVAVLLGALLLHEQLDLSMIVGAAMVVGAVILIVSTDSRSSARERAAVLAGDVSVAPVPSVRPTEERAAS
jgi:drug/metabolite transporter (DMT)-like permease